MFLGYHLRLYFYKVEPLEESDKMSFGTCLCCCCTSSRGASFFCTSIHLFIGMYLSVKWIVVTYIDGMHYDYFEDERMRVIYPLLLVYLSIFLVLGCINFISVERESTGVLKWSMRVFLLLQISMLLANTLLAFAFPEYDNDLALHRFYHIKYIVLNVIGTSIYFYVLWKFSFSLENGIYVVHKKPTKKFQTASENLDRPSSSRPSAPWSNSPSLTSRLNQDFSLQQEVDDQTLPLKTVPPSSEPQPCSSKS